MHATTLPFNPNPLLGIGISFIPFSVLQRLADLLFRHVHATHPRLQERLIEANDKTFLFVLRDMPFRLTLSVKSGRLVCRILPKFASPQAHVTIHAASHVLLSLLEGTEDGDALFFSRALQTEGDTEALLILRHALDNEAIQLRALVLSLFGPLEPVLNVTVKPFEKLGQRLLRDLSLLHTETFSPIMQRLTAQAQQLSQLEHRLKSIETLFSKQRQRSAVLAD